MVLNFGDRVSATQTIDQMTHAMIVGQELTSAEVDMVTGAKGIGSVSSDGVFGAGAGLAGGGAALVASGVGAPGGLVMATIGGFLMGWGAA